MAARIIIGALTAWKYPDRRDRCERTWVPDAERLGLDVVFLAGVPDIERPQRYGRMLCLPCPGDYPSLPQRTRWFCRWALSVDGWEYLFKCDDDTYVVAARLAAYDTMLEVRCDSSGTSWPERRPRDYIGAEWKPGVAYGSGGGGYLLSRRAATIAAEKLTHETGAEDALVGQVLREAGIRLSIEPRFVPFGSMAHRPKPDNDLITVHGVNEEPFLASHREVGGAAIGD